jgi:hypothetical protein
MPFIPAFLFGTATFGLGGLAAVAVIATYLWWPRLARFSMRPLESYVRQRRHWMSIARYGVFALPALAGSIPLAISISQIVK